jgi:DNA-binding LacI/PurR family transcriptional regulator
LLAQLTKIGREEGFTVEVFSDTRPHEESDANPPAELKRLVHSRWVQGLVADVPPQRVKWFNTFPIPRSAIANPETPHAHSWNREMIVTTAVKQLAARGCRKIGVICPLVMSDDDKADSYQKGVYHGLQRALKDLDLPFNPAWSQGLPHLGFKLLEQDMPSFGFQAVSRIMAEAERPDGLFIYPDTVTTGAVLGLSKLNISIPDECSLMLHGNVELPIFCPFPVDRVVVKVEDAAVAMVAHIRDQLAGNEKPLAPLPSYIETYPETFELRPLI